MYVLKALSTKEGGLWFVARALLKRCATCAEDELKDLLIEFCINPKVVIQFSDEPHVTKSLPSDNEMADALRELQDSYERGVRSDFVLTTIAKEVFETLDHALAIGKMVVIEGESGSGKTTPVKASYEQHQTQPRF